MAEEPQQSRPHLLMLPPEIRHLIWTAHLTSTILTSGKVLTTHKRATPVIPAPNSLALLRTCRQIHQETHSIWLPLVLFDFTHIEFLLDKFTALPPHILSQIHRARVTARPLELTPPGTMVNVFYRLGHAFRLVPGLQLKCLDVVASTAPEDDDVVIYDTISSLIKWGSGWRELRFFIPHSRALGYKRTEFEWDYEDWSNGGQSDDSHGGHLRKPQPGSWTRMLRRRDSGKIESEVTVYRAREGGGPHGAVFDPTRRESLRQERSQVPDGGRFGIKEDPYLMSAEEVGKEMLIVIKRAPGVDIIEQSRSRVGMDKLQSLDIRQWGRGMSWAEIKRVARAGEDDGSVDDIDSHRVV